jgi:hypothetical protein
MKREKEIVTELRLVWTGSTLTWAGALSRTAHHETQPSSLTAIEPNPSV